MVLQLKPLPVTKAPQKSSKVDWEDLDALADSPNESAGSPYAAASPPTAWLDHRDMPTYGAAPLEPEVPVIRCTDCDKPILASALTSHKVNCEKIKKANVKGKKDSGSLTGSKRKATEDELSATGDNSSQPPKKKTKKELAKAAAAGGGTKRVKGPAHLDKHCCVINEKGFPCSRSITCKVHSMVAKRAVQGRSKSYDELLLDWKRENVPGFVEPVKKETKAERKAKKEAEKEKKRLEMLAAGIVPGSKKKANAAAKKADAAAGGSAAGDGVGGAGGAAGGSGARSSTKKSKKGDKAGEKGANGKNNRGKGASAGGANNKDGNASGNDDDDEEDYDSEVEYAALVQSVRQARPYTAVPIAQPTNMANFFVARNEVLRNCFDTMGFALSGGTIRSSGVPVVGTAA
ncbi:hypothetical protein FRB94_004483 [Tulasnella sp. JGI-2019a]|nr:hypothetical protein FRB94_004483 [Tulasnella sp. JGI-2019a]